MGFLAHRPGLARAVGRVIQRIPEQQAPAALRFDDVAAPSVVHTVPTRHGDVRVTAFLPPGGAAGAPVHVNFHGGGYVLGWIRKDEPLCRWIAVKAGSVVLNVDYALAPAHPFPTAPEQAYDVVQWAARAEREWDGNRLTVGGQSAGAGLALAACRQALDEGTPVPRLQVLQYPPSEAVHPRTFPKGAMLRPWMLDVFDASYVPNAADRAHPWVSPSYDVNSAADVIAGLAPAVLVLCREDTLYREGCMLADDLEAAGVMRERIELDLDHSYNVTTTPPHAVADMYDRLAAHVREAVGR